MPAPRRQPLDVAAAVRGLTLRIVGQALLSIDLVGEADRIGRAVTMALEYLEPRINYLLASRPACRRRGTCEPDGLCGPSTT